MKDTYSEFYQQSKNEIDKIWEKGIFSFDANALLNLYRYSPNTQNDFINVLRKISDQVWISYQAGYEYHKNRLTVINSQIEAYKSISETIKKNNETLQKELNSFKRHPYIEINEINKAILKYQKAIIDNLDKQNKSHPDYKKKDPILSKLNTILKGKFGSEFTADELKKIYQEGSNRYEKQIPPGYADKADKKKLDDNSLYGDLIIWKELIAKAKKDKKPIIFITDDTKEDWWYMFKGETISPRSELMKEFKKETGVQVLIYQTDIFIKHAKNGLLSTIKEETIEEIKDVNSLDQSYLENYISPQTIIHSINGQKVLVYKGDPQIIDLSKSKVQESPVYIYPTETTAFKKRYVLTSDGKTVTYIDVNESENSDEGKGEIFIQTKPDSK